MNGGKVENESCRAHRAKFMVPFGKVNPPLFYHLFILESLKKNHAAIPNSSLIFFFFVNTVSPPTFFFSFFLDSI